MSVNPVKLQPWVAIVMIVGIGVAYFVFLYKSWDAFQTDRLLREEKLNVILDRLPKPQPVKDDD